MRHATLPLACFLAGCFLFAPHIAAQTDGLAISAPARHAEALRPPAAEEDAAAPSALPQRPAEAVEPTDYGNEEAAYALPAVQICPSNFQEILPAPTWSSGPLFGLLGLLLLGAALAGLGRLKGKN